MANIVFYWVYAYHLSLSTSNFVQTETIDQNVFQVQENRLKVNKIPYDFSYYMF